MKDEDFEIQCPNCKQRLRIPKNIGGMLMKCPSCGQKLYSDFKIGADGKRVTVRQKKTRGLLVFLFELPTNTVNYLKRFF